MLLKSQKSKQRIVRGYKSDAFVAYLLRGYFYRRTNLAFLIRYASKTKELNEEDIRGYFKCNATEPKEKAPKKQSVKFAFDEISDFFPDMQPKEVKDKIIEILFAWYDAQQNAVMAEPTELDAVIMNGGECY